MLVKIAQSEIRTSQRTVKYKLIRFFCTMTSKESSTNVYEDTHSTIMHAEIGKEFAGKIVTKSVQEYDIEVNGEHSLHNNFTCVVFGNPFDQADFLKKIISTFKGKGRFVVGVGETIVSDSTRTPSNMVVSNASEMHPQQTSETVMQ